MLGLSKTLANAICATLAAVLVTLLTSAASIGLTAQPVSDNGPEGRALASIVVQGQFRAKLLTLNWANVKNAAYYKVGIWKGGFIGPIYGTTKVISSTYSAATSKVPVSAAGVRIVVDAFSSSGKKIAGSRGDRSPQDFGK